MSDLHGRDVRGPEALGRVAGAMLDRGVDFIKVNATERAGLPETDPRKPFFTEAELSALVAAASGGGVPVAAHAHGDRGARAAVAAGARSIEHGTYLREETLRLMRERGTFLVPTIAVVSDPHASRGRLRRPDPPGAGSPYAAPGTGDRGRRPCAGGAGRRRYGYGVRERKACSA